MKEYDIYGNIIDRRSHLEKKRDLWRIIAYIIVTLNVLAILSTPILIYIVNAANETIMAKPIIYLYPEQDKNIVVSLGNPEKITCSYPDYNNGWNVIAKQDGTLIDLNTKRELYALYWEGEGTIKARDKKGFVVKGEDTAKFLEEKLGILGLNAKEKQEFIIYWLPKMQDNTYNYIRFATIEEINEYMPLEFSEKPDSLIRVYMQFKSLDKYEDIEMQELKSPERTGFVAVEWGGTELK